MSDLVNIILHFRNMSTMCFTRPKGTQEGNIEYIDHLMTDVDLITYIRDSDGEILVFRADDIVSAEVKDFDPIEVGNSRLKKMSENKGMGGAVGC